MPSRERSLSFDPRRPLDGPAPKLSPGPGRRFWGLRELDRFLRWTAGGRPTTSRFAAAISADALLRSDNVEVLVTAGCDELHVDLHTLGPAGDPRARALARLVERLQRRGVRVSGTITVGLDHDDPRCFERLVEWAEGCRLFALEVTLWTPEPGSPVARQLADARRLLHRDLSRWDGAHVVVAPAQMSSQTLYRGWVWCRRRLGSLGSRWRRRPRERAAVPTYLWATLLSLLAPTHAHRRTRGRLLTTPEPSGLLAL